MKTCIRFLIAAFAALGLAAPLAYADHGSGDSAPASTLALPSVSATTATQITTTTAKLQAAIDPNSGAGGRATAKHRRLALRDGSGTVYRFELGTTTDYGLATARGNLNEDHWTTVKATVNKLTPGTTYHVRAVAMNAAGTAAGPDATFQTPAQPGVGNGRTPRLGHTVVASSAAGTVLVKPDGESEFQPLEDAAEIPVNSTIDASDGKVVLRTALGGGDSQTGTFHGGAFEVSQARHAGGMTTLALRGSLPSCGNSAAAGSGRLQRGGTQRRLWGKDHGGRFKTVGKGSVATVRGTSWYMADRCDGTVTRVSSGQVLVRERGTGRHKLLSRGESFLAHYHHCG
jgi:hypothetical protein